MDNQPTRVGWWRLGACVLVIAALTPMLANAVAPRHVPDEELAQQPVIVVGRWAKAPARYHARKENNVLIDWEVHTELVVERVVKGDIKPGTHKILVASSIHWSWTDGGTVSWGYTKQYVGEVGEVTRSNLWFLTPARSRDKADPRTYLKLTTYRGVQPLEFEGYFKAIAAKEPGEAVVKLLAAESPLVIERALQFLAGGTFPWPDEPGWFVEQQGIKRLREPMRRHAADVEKLLKRKEPVVRRQAAAVFAELAGKDAATSLRELLKDTDAEVRAVAAGALVRHGDRDLGPAVVPAVRGLTNGRLACRLVEALRSWADPNAVPALIEFLQNDRFIYQDGDDIGVPALMAQAALKDRTGHAFPTDVAAVRAVWERVRGIKDVRERAAVLAKLIPHDPRPLTAEIRKAEEGIVLVLTNRSERAVVVPREPDGIEYEWTNGVSGLASPLRRESKDEFVTLAPGASLRIKVNEEANDRARLKRLTVRYLTNGNALGVNAWLGSVELPAESK